MIRLDSQVSLLSGIGAKTKKILEYLEIETCRDLIFYFPFRYDDYSNIVAIRDVKPLMTLTVQGVVQMIENRRSPFRKKNITEAIVADDSGSLKVVWFNQHYITKNIAVGDHISLSGKTNDSLYDLTLVSPIYEKVKKGEGAVHTGRLVPVYPLTAGITHKQFRTLVKQALDACLSEIEEWVPSELLQKEQLVPLLHAIKSIHFPDDADDFNRARKRLQFDELLLFQLAGRSLKRSLAGSKSIAIAFQKEATTTFMQSLPFTLTGKQKKATWDILKDMERETPMCRLLEGDVGSGKTVCASIAMAQVAWSGCQAALLAPTEILVQQHYQTLCTFFKSAKLRIALLTSSTSEKKDVLRALAHGEIDIIVGTHALLESTVIFSDLALVVIDEQHRFGVRQRACIREKRSDGYMPHLLSMTATPIPRSLALALYGDLDISIIDEKPRERKKIITKSVPLSYRQWTYDFIKKEISQGRQAFVLCPLIDPSDTMGAKSVKREHEKLTKEVFPDLRVGMLHGRMKQTEKEKAMNDMLEKKNDILVCTSIVEVGIDIPNASIIVIEGAERFGLAQLHQFRGRVGRSEHQSYCFLFSSTPFQSENTRLKSLVECDDGFALAEKDLKLRGSGELYGVRQSGLPTLKIAMLDDAVLLKKAHDWAVVLDAQIEKYPAIGKKMAEFEKEVHLE